MIMNKRTKLKCDECGNDSDFFVHSGKYHKHIECGHCAKTLHKVLLERF